MKKFDHEGSAFLLSCNAFGKKFASCYNISTWQTWKQAILKKKPGGRPESSVERLSGYFLFSRGGKFCYLPTNAKSSFFGRGDVKLLNVKCRV